MFSEATPAETPAKASIWVRITRFLRSWDEALSRTETDDIVDRIARLERRVDALESLAEPSDPRTADHRA